MNIEQLTQGNILKKKIEDFENAMNCFERVPNWDSNQIADPVSLNPSLIIEFDDWDDGRDQIKLPMVLSDCFINMMKDTIKQQIEKLKKEFEAL